MWFNEKIFLPAIKGLCEWYTSLFAMIANMTTDQVNLAPSDLGSTMISTLETISENAIVPLAAFFITYTLVQQIVSMLQDYNSMQELGPLQVLKPVFSTVLSLYLAVHAFDIAIAMFDLSAFLVEHVSTLTFSDALSSDELYQVIQTAVGSNVGLGFSYMAILFVMCLALIASCVIILTVVWSRLVSMLLLASVAPLPLCTLVNRDWTGGIGQNYLKNLLAYSLQSFLILVILFIFNGLLVFVTGTLAQQLTDGNALMLLCMYVALIFVCVKSILGCLSMAKSILSAQ